MLEGLVGTSFVMVDAYTHRIAVCLGMGTVVRQTFSLLYVRSWLDVGLGYGE